MSLESLLERRDIPSEVQEVIKKELSELKGTKARLEYLLKSGPAIIYACEPWGDYQTKFMSENVKNILGYNSDDFLYNPSFWVDRLHPEDKQEATESFSKILETHFFSETYRFQQRDGTYRWMLEEANLIHDEKGQPLEIVGYWTDITTQKEAVEQLRRERENLYRILNSTDDIIYIINSQHEIEFINAATEKEFGPVDGKRCYQYFNDFLEACPWCIADKVANGETIRREKALPRNRKTYDMIDTPFKNLEGGISSLAILRDITERKQTEEALRESEEKYRSFVENFQGIAFKGYEDFSAGFFLGNVEGITGYDEESFISGEIVFNQLIHPEDIQRINNDVEEFMSSPQKATQREYRIIDKNGNLHWIQESIQKFYDEKLKKGGVYGTLVDITERKQAEEALRENQELFTQFMDHLPAAAFIKDKDSVTLFANKFLKDVFGGEKWIGKTAMELFPEEAARKMIVDDQKALTEGIQIITEELRDINNVANTYRTYKFPIKRKNKENLLGSIGIDVTFLQKTEDLLRKERENFYNILNTINDLIYIV
ncbi:MAG: PAS domain-containing protein, partial [Candidatus Hodarchaeota archaeon]